MPHAIETYALTKYFPVTKRYRDLLLRPFNTREVTALKDVTLTVEKGQLFSLLGSNGAGKTTLIKTLCTLILPTSGEAFVNGLNVMKSGKQIRKSIGYVIGDERSFYWRLTGRQNLSFFAVLNNMQREEAGQRIQKLLKFIGLDGDADRPFKDYSTGMRQKLAIARGLLTDPEIIFMDEPTNGLDPLTAESLKSFIKKILVEEEGKTVVFATHNLQDAEEMSDRIAIIHNGRIKFSGTAEDIKKKLRPDKVYVLQIMRSNENLLSKIQDIPLIKNVISHRIVSDSIHLEVEITNDNEGISRVAKEVMNRGYELHSFYEKETTLKDIFSKVIDQK